MATLADYPDDWEDIFLSNPNFSVVEYTRRMSEYQRLLKEQKDAEQAASVEGGIDQDEDHGQTFMITNDGRYVLCMWPYYYYGSGIKMYMIDSVTGEYRKGWYNDSSHSFCIVPLGSNDFMFNKNENADSDYRLHIGRHSMEENFHSYKLDNYNQGGNGIAYGPSDGGTLIMNFGYHNGMFDITQHTTNYPRLYQVIPGALTIAEVEASRGPVTNDWSIPQNSGFEYSDPTTWNAVNPPESGW